MTKDSNIKDSEIAREFNDASKVSKKKNKIQISTMKTSRVTEHDKKVRNSFEVDHLQDEATRVK